MTAATLRLRLVFADGAMIGPGKADLLAGIAETGSISAAGRRLGMSYKRAWMLVDTMNGAFAAPLVNSSRGGARGGGAVLTETGQEVLRLYRALQARATAAGGPEIEALIALRRGSDMSDGK
jgi:molybdate transport system regulatory protein